MKEYSKLSLNVIDSNIESVYAESGIVPPSTEPSTEPSTVPTTPIVPLTKGCWTITTEYCNHNTGSHSELAIIGNHVGDHSGNIVQMVFVCRGIKLVTVKETSGYRVVAQSETGFVIERDNFYNPRDHFEFNVQVIVEVDGKVGAAGVTGTFRPSDFQCVGWTEKN